jgi:hypothetical protein
MAAMSTLSMKANYEECYQDKVAYIGALLMPVFMQIGQIVPKVIATVCNGSRRKVILS